MAPIIGIMASQISGHLWPANSYESISTVTVGAGGTSTVSFTSIPSTYQHLQIRAIARGNIGAAGDRYIEMNLNSDTASNYSYHELYGTGTAVTATGGVSQPSIYSAHYDSNGDTANAYGALVIDILDYKDTNKYKTIRSLSGWDANGSGRIYFNSGNWRSTSAITRIDLAGSADFAQYSQFELYGVKG